MRLKTRRRRERILMFCVCMLCAAGAVGGLGAASHLEKFAIRDVSVDGADKIPKEALVATVSSSLEESNFRLFSKKNIFLYPKSRIEEALAANFPRIKEVSLSRASLLAQAVIVSVEEREAFATWCLPTATSSAQAGSREEKCYVMDAQGFIFSEAGSLPQTAYVFRGGLIPHIDVIGQTFLRGRIQGIIQFLGDLAAAGFKATVFAVDTEKDFTVTLESGPKLRASFDMPPRDIIRNLQTALEAEGLREKMLSLEYIDLRFGNRVYYK